MLKKLFGNKAETQKNLFETSFFELKGVSELNGQKIPKFEISSQVSGPTIFLTSGIHGDEIAGNVILLKFCNLLRKQNLLRGKIVALVGVNQSGGEKLTREIPESGEDLNRFFGGKFDGTVAERLAYLVREEIFKQKPDLIIDLHNDYFFSTPYILLDPKSLFSEKLYLDTAKIALHSGLNVVQERNDEREVYEKSLSAYFVSKNIPSITIEGGPDKLILKKHIDTVVEGLFNILINQGMTKENPVVKNKNSRIGILKKVSNKVSDVFKIGQNGILENGPTVKVEQAGNVQYLKEAGEYVKSGEVLVKLRNEFGDNLGKVLSPVDAFVLGHSEKINVEAGDEVYWLAKV